MEFVRESINNKNTKNIDEWFNKYVDKNSKLYKTYITSKKEETYAELPLLTYYNLWLNKLSTSKISITHQSNKPKLCDKRKKTYRVYADNTPIATIDMIDGKYMYVDIPFQGLTIINKEYMEQFY